MPAADVKIRLQKQIHGNQWLNLAEKVTDENGRVPNFLPQEEGKDNIGVYKPVSYTHLNEHCNLFHFVQIMYK